MVSDNGGTIAQKGFNYQNYVISLVAIRNHKKKNFTIYVESDEDFEVKYDNDYHAYIQVKGQKHSLKRLLNTSKNKPSILEKNLNSGNEESIYKIVVYDFTESDLKLMNEQRDGEEELFESSWTLSDAQKDNVIYKLGKNIKNKLNRFAIVNSGFKNSSYDARKYLKGELVDQGISVDGRADTILNELKTIIELKSEKVINLNNDKRLKRITSKDLNSILWKVSSKARFDKELKNFHFSSLREEKIKREELKIVVNYMHIKKQVIDLLKENEERLENESLVTFVPDLQKLEIFSNLEDNTKYAIIISAYCDILEGIAND